MLATARSGLPSPLKSPTATKEGAVAVPYFMAAWNVPSPLPNKIETLPLRMATAKSTLPSPLKSLTDTEAESDPASYLVAA